MVFAPLCLFIMYIFDRSAVCVHGRTTIKLELVPILVPRTASHEKKFIFVKLQDNVFYLVLLWSSSETQGRSVRSGEKAGRKFSSTGERAPRDRLLPNYFQKFKRMPAADWAQKCFQSADSSFREFVHDGYCLTTLARFVHQACACKGNFYFLLS